jgi:hypothetical protein
MDLGLRYATGARPARSGASKSQTEGDSTFLERSGKDGAQRRAAQAQRGSLGNGFDSRERGVLSRDK